MAAAGVEDDDAAGVEAADDDAAGVDAADDDPAGVEAADDDAAGVVGDGGGGGSTVAGSMCGGGGGCRPASSLSRSAAMFSFLSLPNTQALLLCSILLFNLGMSLFRIRKQIK